MQTTVDDGFGFNPDMDEVSGMTYQEFLQILSSRMNRKIPRTTLNYWIVNAGLTFKPLYSQSDLDLVSAFARWLSRGGTTKTFHQLRRQSNASN